MTKLAKATSGRISSNIDDMTPKDLGTAELVEQRKVETEKWVFIEGCKNPRAITLLIRGGTQRVIDEVDRSLHDALMVVKDVIEKPMIVYGGGSPEAYVSSKLRSWAQTLLGREQLAVEKFAEALESIPLGLARNAGMNPIDAITQLRAKHNAGEKYTGIDTINGQVGNIEKLQIIEPLKVKEQVIKSATESANMILRIDNVVASSKSSTPPQAPMPSSGMEM